MANRYATGGKLTEQERRMLSYHSVTHPSLKIKRFAQGVLDNDGKFKRDTIEYHLGLFEEKLKNYKPRFNG